MSLDPRLLVEEAVYVAGCAYAVWRGGVAERVVAGGMLVQMPLSIAANRLETLHAPHLVHLALDVVLLGFILGVAFRSHLRWPLLASAIQILVVLAYVARIVDPTIGTWSYVTVVISLSYLLLCATIYGAWEHQRRLKAAAGTSSVSGSGAP